MPSTAPQLDLSGLPCATVGTGAGQGVLIDVPRTLAQARAANRLKRALTSFGEGVELLWSTDLQQFRLPPLTTAQLQDGLTAVRGLQVSLQEIEARIEDTLSGEEMMAGD